MPSVLPSIASLLLGTGLLLLGTGMLGTLVGIRLALEGETSLLVGLVMSAYFAGLMAGSLTAHRLISAIGHIRTFAALASLFSAATLLHPIITDPLPWAVLRAAEGACMAGLFMVTESWLNERATNETRGRILSYYMFTVYLAQGAGQFLLNIASPEGFPLFVIASILVSVALVPVAMTTVQAPVPPKLSHFGLRHLISISPLGVAGAVASGVAMGAFYGLGPIFAQRIGYDISETARLMAAAIVGGLLLQWPIGRLSDRFDRRAMIVLLCGATFAVSMALVAFAGIPWLVIVLIALFGGVSFTLYPLCVAHANDYIDPADVVPASGGLLLSYSVGATLGPLGASAAMSATNFTGLFAFTGGVGLVTGVFALWRMRQRPAVPLAEQAPFQPLPRTTPMATELDPRNEPEQLSFDFSIETA